MAAFIYDIAREKYGNGLLAWTTVDIKLAAIDISNYVVNQNTDEFLSDVPGAGIVATSANLSGKSNVFGVFDALDITIPTVTGASIEAALIYRDTGVAGTSELIAYISDGVGFPIIPNGTDILWIFDDSGTKIMKL